MRKLFFLCCLVVIAVFAGIVVPPRIGAEGMSRATHKSSVDSYLYFVQEDEKRLPELLSLSGGVSLLSWIRLAGNRGGLAGSLVLTKPRLDEVQRDMQGERIQGVQHEYVVPQETGWWSLHLRSNDGETDLPDTVKDSVEWINPDETEEPSSAGYDKRWPAVSSVFRGCGRSLGSYYFVPLPCGVAPDQQRVRMSYAFFQRTGGEVVVIGDLAVEVEHLGTVIRGLYDRGLRMMSLAYNSLNRDRRLYFVHFAGTGSSEHLSRVIRELGGAAQ